MKLQFCSDLHLEFADNKTFIDENPIEPSADTLILAGDILPFSRIDQFQDFFNFLSDHFENTFWIPGNHEYYHYNFAHRSGAFEEKIRDNIFLVNNRSVILDNNLLVFTTLWSRISPENQYEISRRMNDYRLIHIDGNLFTPEDSNFQHEQSTDFIRTALNTETAVANKIVITHHLPTFENYPPEYGGDILNQGFASDLDDLITASDPDYWIFGHHHRNVTEFTIGGTQMLTNQLGYVKYGEHSGYRSDRTIEL